MPLHLIKLAVGVRDLDHLAALQAARRTARDGRAIVIARTRRQPRRPEAVIDGGSLHWVIRGVVRCRQRLLDFALVGGEDGRSFCEMVLDPTLVATVPTPWRPFQGWRYLEPADAPADLASLGAAAAGLPPELVGELRALGLL